MRVHTRIENGKAYLEFELKKEIKESKDEIKAVFFRIFDKEKRTVLEIVYPMNEEEPLMGLLLHPHFWNGISDPYLYQLQGYMQTADGEIQVLESYFFALYSFEEIPGKGFFLNGRPFEMKAVRWDGFQVNKPKDCKVPEDRLSDYLEQLVRMGANTILLPSQTAATDNSLQDNEFLQKLSFLCREKGFLLQNEESCLGQDYPELSQLFLQNYPFHTEAYYQYKAKWSKDPFLYINSLSLQRNEKGNYSLTLYSNRKKIALYVDGILFEFLTGAGEYFFEEIPIKKFPAVLTAEAGECTTAITIYEGSHIFHRTITFS